MLAESTEPRQTAAADSREHVRHLVEEACEPVAQFWPMKRFVHHNPIHGLEHLPFDEAVRDAERLLGGRGYLPNREYRQFYQMGRISAPSVAAALERRGPTDPTAARIAIGGRHIESSDVWRAQLLFGMEALEPLLLAWTLGASGAVRRFQDDLPAESRRCILDRLTNPAGAGGAGAEARYVRGLWDRALQAAQRAAEVTGSESDGSAGGTTDQPSLALPVLPVARTVGDWLEMLTGEPVVEPTNAQMIKWVAAFVDEGMADWMMPARHDGLYLAWRALAPRDWSAGLMGIADFAAKVRGLPGAPEEAILLALRRLAVPEERWVEYLSRHLAQLPGWAGLIRWLGGSPEYPGGLGHPVNATQYLAVRLFYETELAEALCRRTWHIPATVPALTAYWQDHFEEYWRRLAPGVDPHRRGARVTCEMAWPLFRLAQFLELTPDEVHALSSGDVHTLLGWLAAFPEERHGQVWLEAYEDTYRRQLLGLIGSRRNHEVHTSARPRAQLVFCIDVRSESFRRHVEAQGPYETYGYAGFFGIPMNHSAFDGDERFPLCPVLLTPKHATDETVRPEERQALQSYASGTRWLRLVAHLFHDLKQHPLSSLMLVDALGVAFGAGLAGKTLAPGVYQSATDTVRSWFRPPVGTHVAVDAGTANPGGAVPLGFTIQEQAGMVEGGLRVIGLIGNMGRLVVLCGHGSVSDNNPYFSALHCGACGGKHGDANARAFAMMANHPEVRAVLRAHGLEVPDDTWFLAAKHITTSDRVEFYDLADVPASHRGDVLALGHDLERAGAAQALERCGRLPRAAAGDSPARAYRHVGARTADWANSRPEWGLSSNAAFIIGRRALTKGLNLQGRTFLHSYNPADDPEGAILERIMTAPLIVGQWINMEHYFSAVDPWFWGSGSKVIHNVVSGVGVMLGRQSDLQTGLPVQTVNDGAAHYHEPMRLLTLIEAPAARISAVIAKHSLLQGLFHNEWLNVVALDPSTFAFERYTASGVWEPVTMDERSAGPA